MAKVFLDTNLFIDYAERERKVKTEELLGQELCISTLSLHILCYIEKKKIPDTKLFDLVEGFSLVDMDSTICIDSLYGPTSDFEDNVQLNSCAAENCDLFLTQDKKLLNMKFFGKAAIVSSL